MEEKKVEEVKETKEVKNNNTTVLTILVILLCALVLILTGYIVYEKAVSKKNGDLTKSSTQVEIVDGDNVTITNQTKIIKRN